MPPATPHPSRSRILAADWSGARRTTALWLAEVSADGVVVDLQPMGREEATAALMGAADADAGVVAGLDFSFSLPAWWLRAQRIGQATQLWADAARLEAWLARCEAPFWGRPGRRRPPGPPEARYRRTELAARPRPGSTFQVGGAGSVGTASLRGMPTLHALRSAGWAVWPFDPWRPPVVVEVWPRLAIGRLRKSDPAARAEWVGANAGRLCRRAAEAARASADALDAAAAGLWLFERRTAQRAVPPGADVALEGWIDGVPVPDGRP